MKAFWESVSSDTLRIVRLISFTLALLLVFATAYLSGWYGNASLWTAAAMLFTAGLGSACNAGIASRKEFRNATPHAIITLVCWMGTLYFMFIA